MFSWGWDFRGRKPHPKSRIALEKVQGATRIGATRPRASEREICLWEGLWEDLWKPLKNLWKALKNLLKPLRGSRSCCPYRVAPWTLSDYQQTTAFTQTSPKVCANFCLLVTQVRNATEIVQINLFRWTHLFWVDFFSCGFSSCDLLYVEGVLKRYPRISDRPKKVLSSPPKGSIKPPREFYLTPKGSSTVLSNPHLTPEKVL